MNNSLHIVEAALHGLGIIFLLEDEFEPYMKDGRLVDVLDDCAHVFQAFISTTRVIDIRRRRSRSSWTR